MNSEQLMNQQRIALLKTIQKENPSLRLYMTDLLYEMEEPESAFNTGRVSKLSNLDRLTAMRLCDAFAVATKYSKRYHLDLSELIEFVSENTLEILSEDKTLLTTPFKERIKYLIRQQFPFRNALLSRTGRQNKLSYEMYDRDDRLGCIDENGHYYYDNYPKENIGLNVPILFTRDSNTVYAEIETNLEKEEMQEKVLKALEILTPREKQVIRLRFGLEDGIPHDLRQVGRYYGATQERIRQIEAKAIRKLHSKRALNLIAELLDEDSCCNTPVRFTGVRKTVAINNFNAFICLQPYCICRHQMKYSQSVVINEKLETVFYCRNCGRIYRLKNGKVQKIRAYHLKDYTPDDVSEKWALFHWDRTYTKDFDKRIEKYESRNEMLHYIERIRKRYNNNRVLLSIKESEIRNIYDLMNKNIISAEEAREKYFSTLCDFSQFEVHIQEDAMQVD